MLVYTFFIRILGNRPGITYFLNFWLKFGLFLHVYRLSFYFTAYHSIFAVRHIRTFQSIKKP